MVKITYDKKSRILSLRLKRGKSVDSDVQDNVVVDRDKTGDVVNVDIMDVDFSEFQSVRSAGRKARVPVLA